MIAADRQRTVNNKFAARLDSQSGIHRQSAIDNELFNIRTRNRICFINSGVADGHSLLALFDRKLDRAADAMIAHDFSAANDEVESSTVVVPL